MSQQWTNEGRNLGSPDSGSEYRMVGGAPGDVRGGYDPSSSYVAAPAPAKRRRRGRGTGPVIAAALAAALIGGAGGAGITYGLLEETSSPVASQTTPVRTVATGDGVNWAEIAQHVQPSVVAIDTTSMEGSGAGSGVIISKDGHILTNDHVVAGARKIQVTTSDGQIIGASVLGSDPSTDLAVLKLDSVPATLTPATLGSSDSVVVGEPVVAVGNPLGLSSTVTTGIVSALDRPVVTEQSSSQDMVVTNAIQVDAAINPGNSGGPLFNSSGEVIGINSSIATLTGGQSTAGSIGLGFAIPIDLAKRVADDIVQTGQVQHAFVGVSTISRVVTADGRSQIGAVIGSIVDGSPAQKAGLREGDAIIKIGNDRIVSNTSLTGFVRQHAPGENVTLEVVRDGQVITVDLVLGTLEN